MDKQEIIDDLKRISFANAQAVEDDGRQGDAADLNAIIAELEQRL